MDRQSDIKKVMLTCWRNSNDHTSIHGLYEDSDFDVYLRMLGS